MSAGKRICLGAIAGAHGVKGDFKIRTFTEAEQNVAAYGPLSTEDGRVLSIKVLRVLNPGLVLARSTEITTREQAEALSGRKLYVPRDALPPAGEGEFYAEDLLGLAAVDEAGAPVGLIVAMHNFGAGDILEVKVAAGRTILVPFSDDAVPVVDLAAGRVTLSRQYLPGGQE